MHCKTIHIVRHGKAVQDTVDIDDYDRPLTEKGIINSISVAQKFAAQHATPDVIISSHAARALHTAHIFARENKYPAENVLVSEKIYFRGFENIIGIITSIPDNINSIMIVGHNPDLTNLAINLGAQINELSTSAVVTICFKTDSWSKVCTASTSYSSIDKKEC